MAWPFGSNTKSTGFCGNCGVRPKFQNYDYCGKTCSAAAETRRNSAGQAISAQGPPTSMARQNPFSNSSPPGSTAPATSNMCENCLLRVKSQEPDEDGTVITHPYCGIRCYQASQQTSWPASTVPAPAAAFAGHESLTLRMERITTPVGRKISVMTQERWKSTESNTPKLKAIYRIDLPGQIYRRFDLALQMNDDCMVRTSYYGGIAVCSLADDSNPTPCASESCGLCDGLRSSFSNLLHGASCSDGDYGPGLYTYSNPAMAYRATVPGDDLQSQGSNFALIQCRVVAKAESVPGSSSYAGFIDDSGVVFCTQSTAIIPTHVLICSAPSVTRGKHQPTTGSAIPGLLQPDTTISPKETATSKASQHAMPVNSNSVSLGSAPSTTTPMAGSIGQVNPSNTGGTKPKPVKASKGKGKAQAKRVHQKPQEKSSGSASSSKQQPGADPTKPAAANQGVFKSVQSGSSNAPQVVPAPKVIPSASPGSDCFYVHTIAGFIPIQNPPPPGVNLFILGADGLVYPAPISASVGYPPIPTNVFSPASAANQSSAAAAMEGPAPGPANDLDGRAESDDDMGFGLFD